MDSKINKALQLQSDRVDAALARLDSALERVTAKVRRDVLTILKALEMSDSGRVADTAANRGLIRDAGRATLRSMTSSGYSQAVMDYLDEFTIARETVVDVFKAMELPITWDKQDLLIEHRVIGATHDELMALVSETAANVSQRVRMAVGAADFGQVAEFVEGALGTTRARASAIADTGINTYFRELSNKKNEDAGVDVFLYAGPDDRLTRPFCHHVIVRGREYTKAEIEKMNNGTGLPVMSFCGGWRCRHSWIGKPYAKQAGE